MNDVVLDPQRVGVIYRKCLGERGNQNATVKAEGVEINADFDPDSIEQYRPEIGQMLNELPDEFRKTGEGWSFIGLCLDKNGRQWTRMRLPMEKLLLLGIAVGRAEYLLPREQWHTFPGGMPYVVIK